MAQNMAPADADPPVMVTDDPGRGPPHESTRSPPRRPSLGKSPTAHSAAQPSPPPKPAPEPSTAVLHRPSVYTVGVMHYQSHPAHVCRMPTEPSQCTNSAR